MRRQAVIAALLTAPLFSLAFTSVAHAQGRLGQVDEGQVGAWYMYFWDKKFEDSNWGLQGDLQYRDWEILGDMEQRLLRGGVTYTPDNMNVMFTIGAANVATGEFGDSDDSFNENRIYQEALVPYRIFDWIYLRHRFRSEQRWVDDQDFRTRYRYAIFADIPLNGSDLSPGTFYLSAYNEIFLNGEEDIGNGLQVDTVDRNRFYGGIGYTFRNNLRFQFGYMNQSTDPIDKAQWQFSLHHSF